MILFALLYKKLSQNKSKTFGADTYLELELAPKGRQVAARPAGAGE
jgi:hypothetical protein